MDEVGRGALCGPVTAAVVCLPPDTPMGVWRDSKALTPRSRERFAMEIQRDFPNALGWADATEVDQLNVRQATILAMSRALEKLLEKPIKILVDGDLILPTTYPQEAVIGGDRTIPAIAAASIVAKVARDRLMRDLDREYPDYGMAQHKGYGTRQHLNALRELGPTPIHRKTFSPVSQRSLWP